MQIKSVCLKIIHWGTYLLMFTPLMISGKFFFPFVGPKSLYFFGLVEIIVAAYAILAIFHPEYRPRLNILLVAISAFIGISVLASVFGPDLLNSFWSKHERMTGLLMWFHLLAIFIATVSVFRKEDWFKVFEVSLIAASVASALSLLPRVGVTILKDMNFMARGGATLGNSSFLATYLLFNVFIALYLFLVSLKSKTEEKINEWFSFLGIGWGLKIFSGAVFLLLAVALIFSTGRASIISFLAGIVLLFLLRIIFCEKGKLKIAGILLLIIISVGGSMMAFYVIQPGNNEVKKVINEKFEIELISKDRIVVWGVGWRGLQERPLLGWGKENYSIVFAKYFDSRIFLPEYGSDIWYDRAHNIVVDTLVTTGILGLIAYLGIFISVLYILWKGFLSQKIEFITAGIFSVMLFSYFLQNLTVFDMASSLMMFFLVLGFVTSISLSDKERPAREEHKNLFPKPLLPLIVLVIFIFSFFNFVIRPAMSSNYLIKGLRDQNSKERVSFFKKSLETSPLGRYQIKEVFDRYANMYVNEESSKMVPVEHQKAELEFIPQELEKTIKESPLYYSSYLKLGKIYGIYARPGLDPSKKDRAEEVLKRAIEIAPNNQQGYWYLTQIKIFQGEFDEAIEIAEKAIELEPRVQQSHMIMIETAKIIGNVTGDYTTAIEKANRAISIDPSWATSIQQILGQ